MNKYYCLGIKGAGMSTLANILYDLGNEVIGYDNDKEHKYTEEGLEKRGIKIYYDESHDVPKGSIVTYSKALILRNPNHPEIKRMKDLGYELKEYNELVGDVTRMFETIGVSGTHGKTTTSLLISHIINNTLGCNYFVGDGSGYATKENKIFVIESDEFNKHFLAYSPHIAIITNVELEHTECYDGIEDIIKTFETFANKAKIAITYGDNENVRKINFNNDVIYYGFKDNNDVVAKNIETTEKGSSFDVYINNKLFSHFNLPLYGEHMILNALAAIIVFKHYNISIEDIVNYMSSFKNAKRRFVETTIGDIVTIDDYAHHPTEIVVTINAARQKYPNKELVAIFKPNTYSRTKEFTSEFIEAFKSADKAYLTDVSSDRERSEDYPGITSEIIIDKLDNCEHISDETVDKLLKHKNAVLLFMSCTDIYTLKEKYEELLK